MDAEKDLYTVIKRKLDGAQEGTEILRTFKEKVALSFTKMNIPFGSMVEKPLESNLSPRRNLSIRSINAAQYERVDEQKLNGIVCGMHRMAIGNIHGIPHWQYSIISHE